MSEEMSQLDNRSNNYQNMIIHNKNTFNKMKGYINTYNKKLYSYSNVNEEATNILFFKD